MINDIKARFDNELTYLDLVKVELIFFISRKKNKKNILRMFYKKI